MTRFQKACAEVKKKNLEGAAPQPPALDRDLQTLAVIDRSLDNGVILTVNGSTCGLDDVELVDRAHVARLQAEVEQIQSVQSGLLTKCKGMGLELDAQKARNAELEGLLRDIEKRYWSVEFDLPADLLGRLKALSKGKCCQPTVEGLAALQVGDCTPEELWGGTSNNDAKLISSVNSLLALDAKGALSPHGIGGLARELLEKCSARLASAALAAPVQSEQEPVKWGSPKTVKQLISQLQTLDPELETVALYRLPDGLGELSGKVKQGHISISYERMDGIWLAPFKSDGRLVLAFWTKLDPRNEPDGQYVISAAPVQKVKP